ncbi:MAG: YHS domain-containing protein [Pyrinomonadaceae bacterium]
MNTTHKDPVCGMEIEEADAAGQSDYNGQIIYFCSTACKEKFDAHPEEFKIGVTDK